MSFTSLQQETFNLLLDYDLKGENASSEKPCFQLNLNPEVFKQNALAKISLLKQSLEQEQGMALNFGVLRSEEIFDSSIKQIFATFDGCELYPTLADKAFQLLFAIVSNHPFLDGNKRIGSLLFLDLLYQFEHLLEKPVDKLFNAHILSSLVIGLASSNKTQEYYELFKKLIPLK